MAAQSKMHNITLIVLSIRSKETVYFLSNVNVGVLTHGNSEFDTDTNTTIKVAVLKYIRDTQKVDIVC